MVFNSKKSFLILILFIPIFSYSQFYNVERGYTPYDTLTDYISICQENAANGEDPSTFSKKFDLGFEMPFFDKTYSSVITGADAVGNFDEDSEEFNFYLFSGDEWRVYYYDDELSYELGLPVISDWRYKYTEMDNKKVLIIEYRHVGNLVFFDYAYENGDVTYQTLFWENGDIEIRFGDVLMDSTIFDKGFKDLTGTNDSVRTNLGVALINPENTEGIRLLGDILNYTISETIEPVPPYTLTTLPPKNYFIKFKYNTSSSKDVTSIQPFIQQNKTIIFKEDYQNYEYELFNMDGRLKMQGKATNEIDLSSLNQGIYLLNLKNPYYINTTYKIFIH